MNKEAAWGVISEERRTLAELLGEIDDSAWETQSLCAEWRVCDVAAHLAMIPIPPGPIGMAAAAIRAHGNFNVMNRDVARAHARHNADELVRQLRDHTTDRTVPIVTNWRNVLFDTLVHGQDIAVPLGITRVMDVAAARAGADRVWTMGWPFHAHRRLRGLRLVATDTVWSVGDGPEVTGPIQSMLLAVTGRPVAVQGLAGLGAATLAERLGPSPSIAHSG